MDEEEKRAGLAFLATEKRAQEKHDAEIRALEKSPAAAADTQASPEGKLPATIAGFLEPFDMVEDRLLNAIFRNTFDAWDNILLTKGFTMVHKDGFGLVEGELKVTKAKGETKHYLTPGDFMDGFGVYRAVMTRLHGATHPSMDYAMECFHEIIADYAKTWQWQGAVLQAAMAHQNIEAWHITDNFLIKYCRPYPFKGGDK